MNRYRLLAAFAVISITFILHADCVARASEPFALEGFGLGASFEAEQEATIRWRGAGPGDAVRLWYSTDDGASWVWIVDADAGAPYRWRVPNLAAGHCMLRGDCLRRRDGPMLQVPAGPISEFDASGGSIATAVQAASGPQAAVGVVYDARTGTHRRTFENGAVSQWYYESAMAPSGNVVAFAGMNGTDVFSIASGALLYHLEGVNGALAFSADGATLVATRKLYGVANRVSLITASTGREYAAFEPGFMSETYGVKAIRFSRDGTLLAFSTPASSVTVWDVRAGRAAYRGYGSSVDILPDGRHVMIDGAIFTFHGRDLVRDHWLGELRAHMPMDCRITPDGARAVVQDRSHISIWNIADGRLVRDIPLPMSQGWYVSITRDGRTIAASDRNRAVIFTYEDSLATARTEAFAVVPARLAWAPDTLDFGFIDIAGAIGGPTRIDGAAIRNDGRAPHALYGLRLTGPDREHFKMEVPSWSDSAVAWPGLDAGVNISYTPHFGGTHRAVLECTTAFGDKLRLPIVGRATDMPLWPAQSYPRLVSFPGAPCGDEQRTRAVLLRNLTDETYSITARISGTHHDEFALIDSGPRLIEPYGTFEVGVAFRGRGDHGYGSQALLELSYSAERPPIVFGLYGQCSYASAVDIDPVGDAVAANHTAAIAAAADPNPTRGAFSLRYRLPSAAHVRLGVCDALGRCVRTVDVGDSPAGFGSCTVDLADQPSGAYFVRLTSGDAAVAVRVVISH